MSEKTTDKMKRDFIVKWIYDDLRDCNWEDWWDSLRKGCMGFRLEEEFGFVDSEEKEKLWERIFTNPFIQELEELIYRPIDYHRCPKCNSVVHNSLLRCFGEERLRDI